MVKENKNISTFSVRESKWVVEPGLTGGGKAETSLPVRNKSIHTAGLRNTQELGPLGASAPHYRSCVKHGSW